MEREKKIIGIVIGVLGIVFGIVLITWGIIHLTKADDTKENTDNNEPKATVVEGSSCGVDCREFTNIVESSEDESVLKYSYNGFNFIVDNGNYTTKISYNGKDLLNTETLPSSLKIFNYNGFKVASYKKAMTQCSEYEAIFVDSNGKATIISELNKDMVKAIVYDAQETVYDDVEPKMEEIEYQNNTVVVTKLTCGMREMNDHIGYKYTYSINNGNITLQNKENIYCNKNNSDKYACN